MYMFEEHEPTHTWLPAEATKGAEEGQQIFPEIVTLHWEEFMHENVEELMYWYFGQKDASSCVSQTVTDIELMVVAFVNWHEEMQEPLDLRTKLGEAHEVH